MKVVVEYVLPKDLQVSEQLHLKKAVQLTLKHLPKNSPNRLKPNRKYELSVSIVTDPQIRKLNKLYRKKDKPTDVLSFSQLEGLQLPTQKAHIGDVVISLPTARRQAMEFGVELKEELARLVIHGVLHLFGYDHELSKKEEKRMFQLQDKIFGKL